MTKHVSKSQKQDKNKVLLNSLSSRFISNQKPLEVSTKLTQLSKLLNSGFSGVLVSSVCFFFCFFFAVVRRDKNLVRRPGQNAAKTFHTGTYRHAICLSKHVLET